MFLIETQPPPGERTLVHSASDLVTAAGCEYRLLCRLDETLGRAPRREPSEDAMLERTAALGERHERQVLAQYEAQYGQFDPVTGRGVVRLDPPRRTTAEELVDAHSRTLAAIEAGADVIYQAAFFDGRFHGRADFLVRTEVTGSTSPDGSDRVDGEASRTARYAVVDTKLARRAKVPALLQLAAYADQLIEARVGVDPQVYLVLGTRAVTSHRLADLLPVFRDRRARMLDVVGAHLARDGRAPWGVPDVMACGRCDYCMEQVVARRDVLMVGGVYVTQRARLAAAGVTTIEQLAAATQAPPDMSPATFDKVQRQAALQLGTAEVDGTVVWAAADGPHELSWQVIDAGAVKGLPQPSPGDVFFDFEGDPLWSDDQGASWGIDYLFGYVERPGVEGEEPAFGAFWAHDLAAERDALVDFVDYLTERRRTYPDLHVYHYAAYEKTHLLSIAARHGVYEEEVDQLLRDGVLVDLYATVRATVRISDRSYSIKKLEPLYMGEELRTGDVKDAAASVVAYAEYCTLRDAGRDAEAAELLHGIADYNRYDCVSTLRLLGWLRWAAGVSEARGDVVSVAISDVTGPGAGERGAGDALSDEVSSAEVSTALLLEEEIRAVVGEDRAVRSPELQALALHGAAVGYYRREAKPFWHEHYSRLSQPVDEWLGRRNAFHVEHASVLTDWEVEPGRKTFSRRLELLGTLPEGTDLRLGVAPYLLYDPPLPERAKTSADGSRGWLTGGSVVDGMRRMTPEGDRDVLVVREQLPTGAVPFPQLPMALTPAPGPGTKAQEVAVEAAARRALESWRAEALPLDPATDLLRRTPPRLVGADLAAGHPVAEGALPDASDGDFIGAITAAVERLDRSYVAVQGPPGTGKTYVGSHVVARLVAQGWRIGVVAQSHAVVENMLRAVIETAGVAPELVAKKASADGPSSTAVCQELDGKKLAAFALEEGPRVVGGTAWDFAAGRFPAEGLDLLVIDEAGQFSLANTIAVSRAARRLLLLGDPQQLPQVSQGTHPEPVDTSALGWLTDGHHVMPAELGYFLPTTWRMHPTLAEAVSTLSYEDRLYAQEATAARLLDGVPPGIGYVPIEHAGNAVASVEEAAEVVRQVAQFLGRAWTTTVGGEQVTRPLGQRDILVVAAYNAQVWTVREVLATAGYGDVQVGTVDKFQGREAPVVIVTFAASSAHDVPRGTGFLLSRNRVNVAVSRAQWRAVVVRSPELTAYLPTSPRGLEELGAFIGLCGEPG